MLVTQPKCVFSLNLRLSLALTKPLNKSPTKHSTDFRSFEGQSMKCSIKHRAFRPHRVTPADRCYVNYNASGYEQTQEGDLERCWSTQRTPMPTMKSVFKPLLITLRSKQQDMHRAVDRFLIKRHQNNQHK